EHAQVTGCEEIFLGVWERNLRAIRFYEKQRFRAVGEKTFVLGLDPQRDIVMSLPIAAAT
ncbi:MAG TPA: hypothetical protein VE861_12705, partial [Gemmatimonadaceae bacterium]|nr:hypothetical protein [Gemmatimonadaceae bacterium]